MAEKNVEQLLEDLKTGPVLIKFKKIDGTIRSLRCTLNFALIPRRDYPKTKNQPEELSWKQITTFRVYDIEARGWRSFKIDSVLSIETSDGLFTLNWKK